MGFKNGLILNYNVALLILLCVIARAFMPTNRKSTLIIRYPFGATEIDSDCNKKC